MIAAEAADHRPSDLETAQRFGDFLGAHPVALLLGLGVVAMASTAVTLGAARVMSARGVTWRDALFRRTVGARVRPTPQGLRARLARIVEFEYELLHLGLGLLLVGSGLAFLVIAFAVVDDGRVVAFDVALANAVHRSAPDELVGAMRVLTVIGSAVGVAIVGVAIAVGLVVRRKWRLAVGWTIAEAGAGALNTLLKALYRRDRPTFDVPFAGASGWSFPSGHSMATFVTAGMVAYMVSRFSKSTTTRLLALFAATLTTLAVGYSRVCLGVHWASDVVGGFAAGAAWVAICVSGIEVAARPLAKRAALAGP